MKKVLVAVTGVLLGLGALACGGAGDDQKEYGAPVVVDSQGTTHGVAPKPQTKKEAAAQPIGDGVYLVGTDLPAGTYTSPGAAGVACFWSVRVDDDQDADVAAIGSTTKHTGRQRVQVRKGQVFNTNGCAYWVKAK